MNALINLDLLAVGIVTAAIAILGFAIFFNNPKSVTNRTFLAFALVTVFYSTVNYLEYQVHNPQIALWLLRATIFSAVWHAFLIFQLFFVFPRDQVRFPGWYLFGLVPVIAFAAALTMTPAVFERVAEFDSAGAISKVENGPGIVLFALVILGTVLSALALLIRKTLRAQGMEQKQFRTVFFGTITTFSLILAFNFVLPAFLDNSRYIALAPVFFFPFVFSMFYSIVKHKLLNAKIISAELLTILLAVVAFAEVTLARDLATILFRATVFVLILVFGILLIRSVRHEVEQREELQKLYDKVEELSHFKTQLLSLASHQIKSPLAAIKGFASLMEDGVYDPPTPKQRGALGDIRKAADQLIDLVNTLLDLRKVEEGKMDYQLERTDLVGLVREVVAGLEPLARKKHIQFGFIPSLTTAFVSADPVKLTQVIRNLIDNSIKYTPSGFVKVDLRALGNDIVLSVSDSGVGVAPEVLPHLFEEFVRDEKVKKKILGTGLGLYIARKITEGHGGKLWAESEGDNKGSTFHISLPAVA